MNYNRLNTLTGWGVFAVALVTYLLTMAPTASFWDCGEFIACSNELQVPHPPGAPFFLLLGRIFAMFAGSNVEKIALMLNFLSALASAFTSLFTFWITTHLAKAMLVDRNQTPEMGQTLTILVAGVVGGLACTFADSVWFNAVEAEVYAMSSFFTAIVVWAMLKWEERADEPGNQRWILLIAYLMGLSIGVHLLNLLTIPALAYIYYFRKYKFSWLGFFATGGIGVVVLAVIQYGIILSTFDIAWAFEQILVGTQKPGGVSESGMGLPVGSGLTLFLLLMFSGLVWGIWYSAKKNMLWLNTSLISALLIYLGFSSYAMIPIRSGQNPVIDENNPENTLAFVSYMKREQYGDRPLLRGPLYNAQAIDYDIEPEYILEEGKTRYTEIGEKRKPKYNERDMVNFPRMYDASRYDERYPEYPFSYLKFVRSTGEVGRNGQDATPTDDNPTASEDRRFFWKYQFLHMYWRYFMWNFAGKESDWQDADWESGLFGSSAMPEIVKNDKTKNHYFYLPFVLGLLGLGWQIKKRGADAAVIGMLFFFTGIAIIIYLNQPPAQPRERDYSFAGSFQTYAIWIGLGVVAIAELLRRYLKMGSLVVAAVAGLAAPAMMAAENWYDHNRNGNYLAPDSAYNLLNSLAPNAVLFTNGDNDTFPLWYLQEVEGVRRDVRVLCLSYVNTDWYIEQMTRKANDSEPLPITMNKKQYQGQASQAKFYRTAGRKIRVNFDPKSLLANGIIAPEDTAFVQAPMEWDLKHRGGGQQHYLELKDELILNLLEGVAKDGWKRPVYFANTVAPSAFLNLEPYFRFEGLAYRILPVKYPSPYKQGAYDADPYPGVCYPAIMEPVLAKFKYRGLQDAGIYYDENARHMANNYHLVYYRLVNHYFAMADADSTKADVYREKAKALVLEMDKKFPYTVIEPELYVIVRNGMLYDKIGMKEEAQKRFEYVQKYATDVLGYYAKTGRYYGKEQYTLAALGELIRHYQIAGDMAKAKEIDALARDLSERLESARLKRDRF